MNDNSTWPIENPLSLISIKNRVDIARMQAYKNFITCIDEEDFYLADILNIFLSFVQQPINFVILNNKKEIVTHFCNDKEHYLSFEEHITRSIKKWNSTIDNHAFPLFPALGLEYYILPVYMQTKKHGSQEPYVIIEHDMSAGFNPTDTDLFLADIILTRSDIEDEFTNYNILIEYIRVATWYFFCDEWDAHKTYFAGNARSSNRSIGLSKLINTSINNTKNKAFQPTHGNLEELKKQLHKTPFPNNTDDKEDGWPGADWKSVLNGLMYRIIRDRTFGLKLLSGMHHALDEDKDKIDRFSQLNVTNMILAYRSYTRPDHDGRHLVRRNHANPVDVESNGHDSYYPYDISYLLFEDTKIENPYLEYFKSFKNKYTLNKNEDYENDGRLRYKNILYGCEPENNNIKSQWYKALADHADQLFWQKISEDKGPEHIVEILSKRESDCIRSICDPVFHTGLIHFNNIFQYFGLERIRGLEGENGINVGKSVADIDTTEFDLNFEFLRIASFYYLFSGMASWDNHTKGNNPRDLAAVLIPIKVRGVVWGVGIHATYFSNPDLNKVAKKLCKSELGSDDPFPFHRQQTWSFINNLTTSLSEHYINLIDQALWRNACVRVYSLIRDHIGQSTPTTLAKTLDKISRLIRGEQRLIPYSLPEVSLSVSNEPDSFTDNFSSMKGFERIGYEDSAFYIKWSVINNDIFRSHQIWKYKGTRSFENHIKHGIHDGLKEMKMNMRNTTS